MRFEERWICVRSATASRLPWCLERRSIAAAVSEARARTVPAQIWTVESSGSELARPLGGLEGGGLSGGVGVCVLGEGFDGLGCGIFSGGERVEDVRVAGLGRSGRGI